MDDFREWLSDNLRYFMLGGAILLIVAVLFFGIRACTGRGKGNSEKDRQSAQVEDQGNVPSSPEDEGEANDGQEEEETNPLVQDNAEVTALVQQYYEALGEKNTQAIRNLTVNFVPADAARIENAQYIERYEVEEVYCKQGLDDTSYVAYANFNYYCEGITTPVPALSWMYVITDGSGALKIDAGAKQDPQISAYVEERDKDRDVVQLTSDVKEKYDAAQENDPSLAAFLAGLGEDASSSVNAAEGTILTVTETCNVRAEADEDAEIIGGLAAGTEIEKKGQEGEWIQIEYEGETAYVHSSLLE